MTPLFALFTFLVTWWITLFAVLPFGSVPPASGSATHYQAAPVRVNLRRKLVWNTLLAALVTLAIHLLLLSGTIPLRSAYP